MAYLSFARYLDLSRPLIVKSNGVDELPMYMYEFFFNLNTFAYFSFFIRYNASNLCDLEPDLSRSLKVK